MKNIIIRKILKAMSILFNPLPSEDLSSVKKEVPFIEKVTEIIKPEVLPSDKESQLTEIPKDSILFQPNVLHLKNPIEPPSSKNPSIANESININEKEHIHKLTLECNEAAVLHLQSLCRFFEINQFEAIARGIWLLSIARDIEIGEKKIGIITTDENGLVTNITPINIV